MKKKSPTRKEKYQAKIENYNKCIDFINSILDIDTLTCEHYKELDTFRDKDGRLPLRWSWNEIVSVRLLRKLGRKEEVYTIMKENGNPLDEWMVTPYYKHYEEDNYIVRFGWFRK